MCNYTFIGFELLNIYTKLYQLAFLSDLSEPIATIHPKTVAYFGMNRFNKIIPLRIPNLKEPNYI